MTVYEHLMQCAEKCRREAEAAGDLRMRLVHERNERTFRLRALELPLEKAGEEWIGNGGRHLEHL